MNKIAATDEVEETGSRQICKVLCAMVSTKISVLLKEKPVAIVQAKDETDASS